MARRRSPGQTAQARWRRRADRASSFRGADKPREAGPATANAKARPPTSRTAPRRLIHFVTTSSGLTDEIEKPDATSAEGCGPEGSVPSGLRTVKGIEPVRR